MTHVLSNIILIPAELFYSNSRNVQTCIWETRRNGTSGECVHNLNAEKGWKCTFREQKPYWYAGIIYKYIQICRLTMLNS